MLLKFKEENQINLFQKSMNIAKLILHIDTKVKIHNKAKMKADLIIKE
jgi:hypothetical protein